MSAVAMFFHVFKKRNHPECERSQRNPCVTDVASHYSSRPRHHGPLVKINVAYFNLLNSTKLIKFDSHFLNSHLHIIHHSQCTIQLHNMKLAIWHPSPSSTSLTLVTSTCLWLAALIFIVFVSFAFTHHWSILRYMTFWVGASSTYIQRWQWDEVKWKK